MTPASSLRPGGTLHWMAPNDPEDERLLLVATSRPLLDVAASDRTGIARPEPAEGACRRYRLDPERSAPGDAERLVAAWTAALADPTSEGHWLLDPVVHAAGLRAEADAVVVCPFRQAPDLDARLAHPALWARGLGPFVATAEGDLVPNPAYRGSPPLLERVERVAPGDPALLLRVGGVDAAVVRGRDARPLLDEAAATHEAVALPHWGRLYCLLLDPAARWLNDPRLRRFIADRIDRDAAARHLFDGFAEPARTLGAAEPPAWDPIASRPLAPTSVPRLTLRFDADDPSAAAIAARLKAELAALRLELTLRPEPRGDLTRALREGRAEAALVVHEPCSDDPILALGETVRSLGPGAAPARLMLAQASGLAEPAARARAAASAEETLLGSAIVVPLLRLRAWLVVDARLDGFHPGFPGMLGLDRVGWLP